MLQHKKEARASARDLNKTRWRTSGLKVDAEGPHEQRRSSRRPEVEGPYPRPLLVGKSKETALLAAVGFVVAKNGDVHL